MAAREVTFVLPGSQQTSEKDGKRFGRAIANLLLGNRVESITDTGNDKRKRYL